MPYQLFFIVSLLCLPLCPSNAEPQFCTYQTYKWNTRLKQAVDRESVRLPYAELQAHHLDPQTGCSVCKEDQVVIKLPSLASFRVCHRLARQLNTTLNELIQANVPIYSITGYRVGMTRGDVDAQGNRTRFSNHSFGIALDINPEQNGLYSSCSEFGPHCTLIRGGAWIPSRPGTLTSTSPIVSAFKEIGFHWGGEIAGKQKDFMHFSLTGY